MKKLLMMAIVLLAGGTLLAQGSKVKSDNRSFIAFHAGPSFPVGDFKSTNMADNTNSGFAKTGINLNLSYGYQYENKIGVVASIFFNKYNVDGSNIQFVNPETHQVIPLSVDHWQFYGISAGPMFTFKAGKGFYVDIKAMGGLVNANAPLIKVQDILVTKETWNAAAILQGGLNLRIDLNKRMFIITSADYLYIDPKFKYTYTSVVEGQQVPTEFHQKMTAVNLTAGIGVKF